MKKFFLTIFSLSCIFFYTTDNVNAYNINAYIDYLSNGKYIVTEMSEGEKLYIHGYGFGDIKPRYKGIFIDRVPPYADQDVTDLVELWTNTEIIIRMPREEFVEGLMLNTTSNNSQRLYTPFTLLRKSTNDSWSGYQKYLMNNITYLWEKIPTQKTEIIVAVIDDGIYINHPDLINKIWHNDKEIIGDGVDNDGNGFIDDYRGWNFFNNTKYIQENGSHGTAVAGIIAGVKNNYIGIAGIADNVKLMPLIACTIEGCPTNAVISAIKYAVDNGANIINLSLGTAGAVSYTNEYDAAFKYAEKNNVLVVVAAGNGDINGSHGWDLDSTPQSPVCNNKNSILGVGASTDDGMYRFEWSNFGSCVDVYAPGQNIITTVSPMYSEGKEYDYKTGTSFSAPIVSGVAALIMTQSKNIDVKKVRDLIISTSKSQVINFENIANSSQLKKLERTVITKVIVDPLSESSSTVKNFNSHSLEDNITEDIFLKDANKSQFKTAILSLKEKGIIKGYADGSFKPFNSINRAEFSKIVIGATGLTLVGKQCFSDVGEEWFAPYVCTAQANGIIKGYADGSFMPVKEVNVVEALKITLGAFSIKVRDVKINEEWFTPYVEYAKNNDMFLDTFKELTKTITREEMAELIYRNTK